MLWRCIYLLRVWAFLVLVFQGTFDLQIIDTSGCCIRRFAVILAKNTVWVIPASHGNVDTIEATGKGGSKQATLCHFIMMPISSYRRFDSWQKLLEMYISLSTFCKGFPGGLVVKNLSANAGDAGLIPGLRRSPGEGYGIPLQYSGLEHPRNRGAWEAIVHGVAKNRRQCSNWAQAVFARATFATQNNASQGRVLPYIIHASHHLPRGTVKKDVMANLYKCIWNIQCIKSGDNILSVILCCRPLGPSYC